MLALLAHAESPLIAGLLDALPRLETHQFAPAPGLEPDQPLPDRMQISPYRLLRQIGKGGMAAVWLAERTDLLQSRKVALKLPHGAWRRARLAERMARERKILATLEHPNIARLYDAGLADDGQRYLALEYVEGQRIDVYCRERALDVQDRLRLFLQVTRRGGARARPSRRVSRSQTVQRPGCRAATPRPPYRSRTPLARRAHGLPGA